MKPKVNRLVICTIILLCGALSGSVVAGVFRAIPSFGWSQTKVGGKAGRNFFAICGFSDPWWYVGWRAIKRKKCLFNLHSNTVAWYALVGNTGGKVYAFSEQLDGDRRTLGTNYELWCDCTKTPASGLAFRIFPYPGGGTCQGGGNAIYASIPEREQPFKLYKANFSVLQFQFPEELYRGVDSWL